MIASPLSGVRRTRMCTTQPKSRSRTLIVWLGLGLVPFGRITDTVPAAPSATTVQAALAMLSLGRGEERLHRLRYRIRWEKCAS